jgi:hypothetical protein
MNSYHENLRATVVTSLRSQDLEQKKMKSKLNASMFTLYYAEGAAITADEKLEQAQSELNFKAMVKEQAVKNSNSSNNLLSSANQANQYLKQSTSNTAVCAANVQMAAAAIIRLAGDMGSIFSIINAADSESEIYTQANEALRLINDTAYSAELTSQLAMEASMLTSEVTSSTVLDRAKATNTAMNNLLKVASSEVDASFQVVAANNALLAAVSAKEKVAEGALAYINVDYKAATSSYNAINERLNLDLKVQPASSGTSFMVEFDRLKSPFPAQEDKPLYPVQQYYLLVVKESKSATFSISIAERLVQNAKCHVALEIPNGSKPADSKRPVPVTGIQVTQQQDTISVQVNFLSLKTNNEEPFILRDADEDELKLGVNYAVFVMAVYDDKYKRKLNTYDDFLSAPSQSFCLRNKLNAVDSASIAINPTRTADKTPEDIKMEEDFTMELDRILQEESKLELAGAEKHKSDYHYKMTFDMEENPNFQVQYRCMFLPESKNLPKDLLTKASLKSLFDDEMPDLEKIYGQFDPAIADFRAELDEVELQREQAGLDADEARKKVLADDFERVNARLAQALDQKEKAMKSLTMKSAGNLSFFFNLTLAEQVAAGNYIPAVRHSRNEPSAKKAKGATDKAEEGRKTSWTAFIGPATTDNFGNLLVPGRKYIPVVLSVSMAEEENLGQFANAISDIDYTAPFTYYE